MPAPTPPLADRRLSFVLGKGGSGKTTVSAALGIAAARRGLRTLVVEVSAQHRLTELFRLPGAATPHRDVEVRLAPDLWTISIDPEHATEEYLVRQLKVRPVVELLARSKAFSHFTQAAPGLAELVTLGKIWSLAVHMGPDGHTPVWDRLIVDLPATGHGIALLETAQNIEEMVSGGPIKDQAGRIQQVVRHPAATGIAVVAQPEELSVTEAVEAIARLKELELPVGGAIVNGMRPARFDEPEMDVLRHLAREADGPAAVAARLAVAHQEAAEHDVRHRDRLAEAVDLTPIELPRLVRMRMGIGGVEELAAHLPAAA
ncbi:MAG: ArsA family ATPase [Miltoncostaeaceae bacterium]